MPEDSQAILTGGATAPVQAPTPDPATPTAVPEAGALSGMLTPEEAAELRQQIEAAQQHQAEVEAARKKIEEEKEQLTAQRREVEDALSFRRALQQNPEMAQAIRRAVAEAVAGRTPNAPGPSENPYEDPSQQVAAIPPDVVSALGALAQHGMLTQQQLQELQQTTKDLAEYRQQLEAQRWEQSVTGQVREMLAKYPERYRFADADEVIRAAIEYPDEAKRSGIVNLLRADAEANQKRYERWRADEEKARQGAASSSTLPATAGASPAPARALTGDERTAAMLARLELEERSAS